MFLRPCNAFCDSFVIRDYVMKVLSPQNNFPEAKLVMKRFQNFESIEISILQSTISFLLLLCSSHSTLYNKKFQLWSNRLIWNHLFPYPSTTFRRCYVNCRTETVPYSLPQQPEIPLNTSRCFSAQFCRVRFMQINRNSVTVIMSICTQIRPLLCSLETN